MATYLVDNLTELPESGDLGWGTVLNAAILSIDDRFTYNSNTAQFSLASDVIGSSLTSVGTLSSLTVSGNVSISGNLVVTGSTTTVTSTTIAITDPVFTLGGNTAPTVDDNKDRGIEFRWHNGSAAKVGFFGYDDSTGKFTFIPDATNSSEVFSGTKGELDANVEWSNILSKPDPTITVELTGDVTGNASATLTDLASGTVTLNATISANSVELGTDTTGNYMVDLSAGTGISITHTPGEGSTATVAIGQSVATTDNVTFNVVTGDVIGDVKATDGTTVLDSGTDGTNATFTGGVTGNASTASALETSRTIELTGDVTGSVSFDGSANVQISTTVSADSVELGTDTTGNYVVDVSGGTGISVSHTQGEGSTPTVSLNAALNDLTNVSVSSPSDGQFLKYVSASSDWQPADIPTINNLDDVGDVTITSATSGDFLKWNGTAWVNDVVDLGTDTTGNYMTDLSGGTGVTITHTPGEGSTATVAIGQDVANTASVVFSSVTATTLYVDSIEIDTTGATSGQVLAYDGTKFAPTAASVDASALTGNTLASGVVNSSLTSVGTLTGLTVSGNTATSVLFVDSIEIDTTGATSGQVLAYDGTKFAPATVSGGSGTVDASALTGNTLASGVVNSSLTSVGTLTGLTVSGNTATSVLFVDSIEIDTTGATSGQVLAYDGTKFAPTAAAPASASVSTTVPSSPSEGDLWFRSDTEVLYIYVGSSWLQIGATSVDGGAPSTTF